MPAKSEHMFAYRAGRSNSQIIFAASDIARMSRKDTPVQ